MDELVHDLRYAIRKLSAAPAFTFAAVATLAIGIGATTAIFSTVNATLLRPLPYDHPDELIALRTRYADGRVTTGLVAAAEIARIMQSPGSVVRAAGFGSNPFETTLLRENAAPAHASMAFVGEGFFEIFGLPMTIGSAFSHEQQAPIVRSPGNNQFPTPLVILSYRAWTELFGSDSQIVGKTIHLAEFSSTITGVGPRDLDVPRGVVGWLNARFASDDIGHGQTAVLRVKPGTTLPRLRSELAVTMTGLARDFPVGEAGRDFVAEPLVASIVGDLGPTLLIVFAATALLLLLACVNVTNLLLGRGAARAREIAVRTALGASRGRIVRQLMTESFLVTALGSAAGLCLAFAGVRALQALGASKLPRLESIPFDGRVLGFAATVLVASGAVLGLAPALRLARTDLKTLINESGRSTSGGRGTTRLMGAMTVAEVALALILVAGAGWLVQSFSRLRATDPGFTAAGRLIVDVRPSPESVRSPDQIIAWTRTLFDRLRALPGVVHVSSTAAFPLRGNLDSSVVVLFQGDAADTALRQGTRMRLVTPGFFAAMGVPLVSGRDFTVDDRRDTQPVAIVNREFVKRYLTGRDPLRTSFAWGYPTVDTRAYRNIVGVVGDVRHLSMAQPAEPSFYVVQGQFAFPRQTVVIATGAADPAGLAATVRGEIARFEPQLAVDVDTVPRLVASTLTRQQLGMTLMLIFGATALVLAAVGIYGVIAYTLAQRLGEIATRLALGATPRQVFWLLMRRGQWLAAAGVAIGLAAAFAGGRTVAGLVYGIRAFDPAVLAAATGVVVLISWIATAIPARRASRVDPILALRGE